ncbi:MAG TPA: NYN domain-containing protein, partial [Planctomycetota bacterium]|nr:NYN domain-containing protein [Planctomycetota bacterium]
GAGDPLRIHYYDAPPAIGRVTNPLDGTTINLRRSTTFTRMTSLHDEIESAPDFAVRRGEVVARGWKLKDGALRAIAKKRRPIQAADLLPDLRQKGVDLRMGLDIARLSLRRLVDVIVVVTGDSDLVPAFRFARREGIRIYLDHLGAPVMRDLKAHTDLVLRRR